MFIQILFSLLIWSSSIFAAVPSNENEALSHSKDHWEKYYENKKQVSPPSHFATTIIRQIDKTKPLLELGCGDGRDALYFAQEQIEVYACDLSASTIQKLSQEQKFANSHFFVADFTSLDSTLDDKRFGTIYSRFTLHSIPKEDAAKLYQWCYNHLDKNGCFFIEARSIHDPLYGKGQNVGNEAFFTDHYRRFLRLEELVQELQQAGFHIDSAQESKGWAKYKDEDPIVIRIVAKK